MKEYYEKLDKLGKKPEVERLKKYPQHCCTTRFKHCNDVADYSYRIAKAFKLNVDERSLRTGAMLHDYYLYDTKSGDVSTYEHWMHHPETALKNAEKIFDLNDKEKNIIRSHMWPLNPIHMPDSTEGWLVCIADKYCALREVVGLRLLRKIQFNMAG